MICKRLKDYLDKNGVNYRVLVHSEAFTAQEIAAALHVPGKELAKVVIIKSGERFVMTVLPASRKIDMHKLKDLLQTKDIRLATEEEFGNLFPDCEVGAMPPFGNLYDIETYVDRTLSGDKEICFLAGNHTESIRLSYDDYVRLVKPKIAEFCMRIT